MTILIQIRANMKYKAIAVEGAIWPTALTRCQGLAGSALQAEDNLFESSTSLLSKHNLQTIYINQQSTSTRSQKTPRPEAITQSPTSPHGGGVTDCTNSKINKH